MELSKFTEKNQELAAKVKDKLGGQVLELLESSGDIVLRVEAAKLKDIFQILKIDTEFKFDMLVSVTAVDFLDRDFYPRPEDQRFDLVYHLLSIEFKHRLRVKASVSEEKPEIASLVELYDSANFMERETWDMYGIKFLGHPDLRRILMYDEFEGHPLRKDYPVQGKQPRVELRYPEVENTARQMHRPDLVQINQKRGAV